MGSPPMPAAQLPAAFYHLTAQAILGNVAYYASKLQPCPINKDISEARPRILTLLTSNPGASSRLGTSGSGCPALTAGELMLVAPASVKIIASRRVL